MKLTISVFGTGYVGLVTGVCFAEVGNHVIGADIDLEKVGTLQKGISPIYEPGLTELLTKNMNEGRMEFTADLQDAIHRGDLLMIAVGTPPNEDGSADLKYVLNVAETIARTMNSYKLIVTKSTVPVGTYKKVQSLIRRILQERGVSFGFDLVSNPEFLREGCAIEDCLNPSRAIVGAESERAVETMRALFEPLLKGRPLHVMNPASSEMTKYAANSMLATKISLMNEFSRLCEKVGADIESVREGLSSDHRIGPHFIYAGVGYGGSCFPKDVKALIRTGTEFEESLNILKAVEEANQWQRDRYFDKVLRHFNGQLDGRKIAVWGVAFKPGTDDIREAPAIDLITRLVGAGALVSVFDPVAERNTFRHFLGDSQIEFFQDPYEALEATEALCIMTEWQEFRAPDFDRVKIAMADAVIFDGRNIYAPEEMSKFGLTYHSVGRTSVQEGLRSSRTEAVSAKILPLTGGEV